MIENELVFSIMKFQKLFFSKINQFFMIKIKNIERRTNDKQYNWVLEKINYVLNVKFNTVNGTVEKIIPFLGEKKKPIIVKMCILKKFGNQYS